MLAHNADIAAIFEKIAGRLEIEGANPLCIRAYRNAARTPSELPPISPTCAMASDRIDAAGWRKAI